jgi:hypothetical protein
MTAIQPPPLPAPPPSLVPRRLPARARARDWPGGRGPDSDGLGGVSRSRSIRSRLETGPGFGSECVRPPGGSPAQPATTFDMDRFDCICQCLPAAGPSLTGSIVMYRYDDPLARMRPGLHYDSDIMMDDPTHWQPRLRVRARRVT